VAASGAMGPGRRGEGDGAVASEGFHTEEEESKGGDGEQHTLRASRRRGVGWGSGSWPREGRWMGGVSVRHGWEALGGAVEGGSAWPRWKRDGE
jgi:hypothetical protein